MRCMCFPYQSAKEFASWPDGLGHVYSIKTTSWRLTKKTLYGFYDLNLFLEF